MQKPGQHLIAVCIVLIPNITNLVTTAAFTTVENKIPNVSHLVKKTNYNTKISEIEKKLVLIIMINVLLRQSLISLQKKFLMQD